MASTPPNPPSGAEKRETLQQDALMREVDEAVRQDQFAQAARKYGVPVGIVALIGLAAFGGWLWWSER
ncbi:MAG TPA: hypothetical protein VLA37_05325, partial [Sphingomonadaceae bacterium]|nr:hypothetical protein [Sphingomonadaceae bacterium]